MLVERVILHNDEYLKKVLLLLVARPLRGMGAWRKTMEPQKSAAQRVRSWTVQNEMRDVLGRVSTGAAGRILDFANPMRDKNLKEGCVPCSVDERRHSEHDEGAQVPQWKLREPVCQNTSMRQYASSPRKDKVDTRSQRRETTRVCRGCK